ncbi:MAG: CoA transferase [Acidimicrobiia bacterium]|nr:CoA transferase [Acidimicrobiia bacterium]
MLGSIRVLDCTDERGQLAGFMLAQLGADVVLVEPAGGSSARHLAPFAGDEPDPETGLWHWAYNRGKRSVVADHRSAAGRARLAALAERADVLLCNGEPAELTVDLGELEARNPALVTIVMSAFGLDGPKAGWAASDLTVAAASGSAALIGDRDRAPLRWGSPQAWLHGATDMAVAALVGLHERARSGRGQRADVSAQVSAMAGSFCYTLNRAWGVAPMQRSGSGVDFGAYRVRWTYPALDGAVTITMSFGAALAEFTANLFRWVYEEGFCDEATRDSDWKALGEQLFAGDVPASEADRFCDVVAAFTATRTKAYLVAEATRRRVLLAPIATLAEVMADAHLADRRFWDVLACPAGGPPRRLPGRFVVAGGAALAALGPPPRLGEHDLAVDELWPSRPLGALAAEVGAGELGRGGVGAGERGRAGALDGLKVLDLAWSVAGPSVGRLLADFGATVVRVEHRRRPDVARTSAPYHPASGAFPTEGTILFADVNAGKLGIELDLATDEGRRVCVDLARWADVAVESFSAGALARMGLGYDVLAAVNPALVLLSSCLPGQTGSLTMPGLGNLTTAHFGFTITTGWPDRVPSGPFGAYTDIVSPRFGLAAILAALEHRRRTGLGQHLDLSQAESSLHLQAVPLLDAEINGRAMAARGNRDDRMAPHGVYRAAGEDGWVAIACRHDADWAALASTLDRPELAGLRVDERRARHDELDALVGEWTRSRGAAEAESALQSRGIPSHQVQGSAECLADPQLAYRRHYREVDHPLLGPVTVQGPRFELSRTPGDTAVPGPLLGEHRDRVLIEVLGYDPATVAELAASGALGPVPGAAGSPGGAGSPVATTG